MSFSRLLLIEIIKKYINMYIYAIIMESSVKVPRLVTGFEVIYVTHMTLIVKIFNTL